MALLSDSCVTMQAEAYCRARLHEPADRFSSGTVGPGYNATEVIGPWEKLLSG